MLYSLFRCKTHLGRPSLYPTSSISLVQKWHDNMGMVLTPPLTATEHHNINSVGVLQLLGLEVNAINSVQFSNHGAYPTVKGQRLDGKDLTDLADGLEANGLLWHDYLLTGMPLDIHCRARNGIPAAHAMPDEQTGPVGGGW